MALTGEDTDIGIPRIGYLLLHRNLLQNPVSAGRQVSIGSTVFLMSKGTDSFWSRLSSGICIVHHTERRKQHPSGEEARTVFQPV